jgi:AcrR family transcriptional regulator
MAREAGPGTGRPGRRGKRHYKSTDERRAEIIAASLTILAKEGLPGWTTAALAKRVGASEAMLFKHFRSKDEILQTALQQLGERMIARLGAYSPPEDGDPWRCCEGLILTILEFVEETGGGPFIILVAGQLGPSIRQNAQRAMRAFRERIVHFCASGERALPAGATPEVIGDLGMAIVQSSVLRWLLGETRRTPTEIARPMLEQVGRFFEVRPRSAARR